MHKIVAVWTDGQDLYPLSDDGTIVKRKLSDVPNNAMIFMGQINETMDSIIKSLKPVSNKIEYINRIENRRWDIVTKNGIRILLPEKHFDIAISKLLKLENKNKKFKNNRYAR